MTVPDSPTSTKKRRPGQHAGSEWHDAFIASFQLSGVVSSACRHVGIHRDTAYAHRKRDPEFAARWEAAEEDATDALEQIAVNWGTTGLPQETTVTKMNAAGVVTEVTTTRTVTRSPYLLALMLKSRRPERYRERYEVTQQPVTPVGFDWSKLSQDELEQVYDALAKTVVQDVEAQLADA